MAIRFKFRSSIQYDSVDIDNRPSISVRDLRFKIVRHKNLDSCHDFDLVFSDDVTGKEYIDENFQIPTGSSVIIKRIPARLVQSAAGACNELSDNFKVKNTKFVVTTESPKVMDEMDDFGADCCPVPEVTALDCELDLDKRYCTSGGGTNDTVPRHPCLGVPLVRCLALQVNDAIEACPKDTAAELQPNHGEQMNTNKVVVSNRPSIHTHDLPSELRCSLCDTFFKEAMMIPCCQHSFCKKCIQAVLVDKARCPKCCSTKCRVEDLLPNVCLSQAIDRFLMTQILPNVSDNAFLRDAPDGESGIQGRDRSCAVSIIHREQIVSKPAYDSKIEHNDEEGGGSTLHVGVKDGPQTDSQGENQPINFPQAPDSILKRKRELRLNFAGGDRSFVQIGRYIKGDRACYMCGSPDHFIRDCPAASNPPSMFPSGNATFPGAIPGYVSPYWNGATSPHMTPLAHPYCNPGMIPFNSGMGSPFAVSSYMTSVYGGAPFLGNYMRMGPLESYIGMNMEHPPNRPIIESFREHEERWKHSKEITQREQSCDDEDADFITSLDYKEMGRSQYHKSHRDLEKSLSRSEDSFTKKSQLKHQRRKHYKDDFLSADNSHKRNSRSSISGRDRRSYHLERSSSIVENKSYASNVHTEDSHKHHHTSYEVHKERKEQCSSDSSRSHHISTVERHVKYGVDSHLKRHIEKHGGLFKSALVASVSNDKREHRHGKDYRHGEKDKTTGPIDDRWQMIGGLDDDDREEDHHHRKRKKCIEI